MLQAYCYTKRNGKKYKYVPIDSYAIKTDIFKFAKDLNIVSDNGTKQMILTSKEQQEKIENLNEEND